MIEIIVIVALIVYFFYECTRKGMVFSFVADTLDACPAWMKKPLFDCPICMVVWWGPSIIACGIIGNVWQVSNVWKLSMIIAAAAGTNTFINYLVEQGKAISKSLNESDCNCTKKETVDEKKANRKKRLNII